MKSRGFTLIELMIVVAIIAIIAAIAIPNLLRSRMAANESAAMGATKAFAEAQDIYRRTDWNKDGVLEYATAISGNLSLFKDQNGNDIALVDKAFSDAEGSPGGTCTPKAGYCFAVLTGQGASAPGGSKTYFSGSRMTLGYALSTVPFSYDGTGRNTFCINNTGSIYQKDRGAGDTGHLTLYNPDSTWAAAE